MTFKSCMGSGRRDICDLRGQDRVTEEKKTGSINEEFIPNSIYRFQYTIEIPKNAIVP